ncbi:Meiotically up-regulated gene 89 protein [Psilocybe cubensis]|uniref:Cell cycle control protein n=2 Tax=Psilocybe cubensis TaxID=181762 RepID=A0A8H7Y4Q8_PSICU|nr:Meiotically up-regulated gene 89 protein [Psilocybe cubensis]KAH9483843.1 Meiotically up-regulated gene 89 protein [Psilocybe cubensis]
MGLFNRKKKPDSDSGDSSENKKEKGGWKRPANTAFKQQRLKAWQPILTPKTVLPTLFIIGIIFAPIGGLLIWGSSLVTEITIDYTDCENQTPSASNNSLNFVNIPSNKYSYQLRSKDDKESNNIAAPRYAFLDNTNNSTVTDLSDKKQCAIQFQIPADLEPSVLLYYKLTNFFQNHRRYVKSLNSNQLKGKYVSPKDLDNSDCKPLSTIDGKAIYPCGLIANSLFNDTFSNPVLLNPSGSSESSQTYNFSSSGIAWPGEAKKYTTNPVGPGGYASLDEIVPPPNWQLRFPNNYTNENPPPDLRSDERFQNWMRTAGLPTFTKLYGRNDKDTMQKGTYQIVVGLNFPVLPYKGTKSIVISTVSWVGGKNPFLGWAYVAAAAVFVLLAILGTARHLIKPRRLGDMSLLSWNR